MTGAVGAVGAAGAATAAAAVESEVAAPAPARVGSRRRHSAIWNDRGMLSTDREAPCRA
jgi:hypothetical protein